MKNIVVLISGGGSNLQAIIDQCADGRINGKIAAVISNRPDAYGLQRAIKAGIETEVVDHTMFADRTGFDALLLQRIEHYQPDLVVLAGFMRILTDDFVRHFLGRMINIHPSLLPKYKGLNTHQRAIETGDKEAGATVHFVSPELDGGPLIAHSTVSIERKDDALSLSKKVLAKEHQLYPEVIRWFCAGNLTYAEGLPRLNGETLQFPVKV
jgi:phosphoribosylglycinamide formyltransferase 1